MKLFHEFMGALDRRIERNRQMECIGHLKAANGNPEYCPCEKCMERRDAQMRTIEGIWFPDEHPESMARDENGIETTLGPMRDWQWGE